MVYAFWDANDRCLYIGRTSKQRMYRRFQDHHVSDSKWVPHAVKCTTREFPSYDAVCAAESVAISTLIPKHNKNVVRRRDRAVPVVTLDELFDGILFKAAVYIDDVDSCGFGGKKRAIQRTGKT